MTDVAQQESVEFTLRRIANTLPNYRYRFSDEKSLHEGIAKVLDEIGLSYQREHIASKTDRFDFLIDGGIVIEAKVDGTWPSAIRQVDRYCVLEAVKAVVIVTSKRWGLRSRAKLRGKPAMIVEVKRAF